MNRSHRTEPTDHADALEFERELRNLEVDLYNDFELYGEVGIRQIREILRLDSRRTSGAGSRSGAGAEGSRPALSAMAARR